MFECHKFSNIQIGKIERLYTSFRSHSRINVNVLIRIKSGADDCRSTLVEA